MSQSIILGLLLLLCSYSFSPVLSAYDNDSLADEMCYKEQAESSKQLNPAVELIQSEISLAVVDNLTGDSRIVFKNIQTTNSKHRLLARRAAL